MTARTPPLSILVVDDDPIFREAIEDKLRATFLGGRIVVARDGAEGLECCRSERFDLIVTDFKMPRLTGLQMLAGVRRLHFHTPAIVASSSELPAGDLAEVGAFLFLPKHELHLLPDFAVRLLGSRAD